MRTPREPIVRHVSSCLRRLLPDGGHVLVAVSGGRDSMALADIVRRLSHEMRLSMTVAHVHHGLRGAEADADATFVAAWAHRWRIPSVATRVRTLAYHRRHGTGIEAAARQVRYRALERIRKRVQADLILTAHHAQDQAETVLLRATRGSHRRGLVGILPVLHQPPVARPLLKVARGDIEEYVGRHRLEYREDESNTDLSFRRNLIRHRLLREVGRRLETNASVSFPRLAAATEALGAASEKILARLEHDVISSERGTYFLRSDELDRWPLEVQNEILMRYVDRARLRLSSARLASLRSLLDLPVGRWRPLGDGGWRAFRERDGLSLVKFTTPDRSWVQVREGRVNAVPGGRLRISRRLPVPKSVTGPSEQVWVDAHAIRGRLYVRWWKPADRIVPLGMSSNRKVSDVLTDRKVQAYRKRRIPVVVSGRKLVWICGVMLDDRAKVHSETQQVLQFSFHSNV